MVSQAENSPILILFTKCLPKLQQVRSYQITRQFPAGATSQQYKRGRRCKIQNPSRFWYTTITKKSLASLDIEKMGHLDMRQLWQVTSHDAIGYWWRCARCRCSMALGGNTIANLFFNNASTCISSLSTTTPASGSLSHPPLGNLLTVKDSKSG